MGEVVLTVDPDITHWAGVLNLLKSAGYETIVADAYPSAVQLMETSRPDVLITVVRLGAHNGLHLVIRGRYANPRMAALVVDDSPDPFLESESRRCGASRYLTKPVRSEEFLALIAAVLADRDRRHSYRTLLSTEVVVRVGSEWATLFDISNGGARLKFASDAASLPADLDITMPNGLSVRMQPTWTHQLDAHDGLWCGASLAPLTPDGARRWRQIVQSLVRDI